MEEAQKLYEAVCKSENTMPRKPDCEWAFANPETGKPYVSIFYAWNTARKSVGLSDVRMHDLRHSFASLLINSGRTLYEVQHILGHTQVKTTQRYAHLSQDTLLAAASSATTALGAAMIACHAGPSIRTASGFTGLVSGDSELKSCSYDFRHALPAEAMHAGFH